ncbi:hypothetical protein FA95DRAFT_1135798 [Auriscalpium vulgare]|uniref:Uncharacterized protein n=1 Tax=Auriscalpium vulgare TaxID=40419 RepID=A0ACB8RWT6_9AGAM|nr:hypothetical protein FA95DRAFT_1135798 [Auriscalpium vulgare]
MPEPSISMPVAQPSGPIFYAQPIQNVPSGYSIAGNSAIAMMPREHLPYDTDETRPLLHAPSMKDSVNYSQSGPALAVAPYYQSGGSSIWPAPLRNFGTMGWQEHTLLTGNTYYSHSSLHITVDIDLRNPEKLEALGAFLEKKDVADTLVLPSDDWELWLRDAGRANNEFIPLRAWVHHTLRIVSLEQPPTVTEDFRIREDDKLELEYRYWAFLEAHPAHAPLPPSCVTEAIDVLTWSYTDRLLPSSQPTPPPFTQSECQDLMALLRSLEGAANTSSSHSVLRTRVVAKILMRILSWRQGRSPSGATSQDANGRADNSRRTSLRRTVGDFLISAVCLGIPYLFLERSHHQRMDAESGLRSTAGPMLIVGAFACVIAAVILSASVTFISLPGLDDVARVAGFVAILLSATSLASGVLAVFRYKVDIERIPSYARGEGLITKRSVLLSLPLVFLIWAIIAFITGVTLYAFRGLATTSPGAISRHFQEYTQWAVVGTVGGLAGMLITSALLLAW